MTAVTSPGAQKYLTGTHSILPRQDALQRQGRRSFLHNERLGVVVVVVSKIPRFLWDRFLSCEGCLCVDDDEMNEKKAWEHLAESAKNTLQDLTTRKYTLPDKNVASQLLMYRQVRNKRKDSAAK